MRVVFFFPFSLLIYLFFHIIVVVFGLIIVVNFPTFTQTSIQSGSQSPACKPPPFILIPPPPTPEAWIDLKMAYWSFSADSNKGSGGSAVSFLISLPPPLPGPFPPFLFFFFLQNRDLPPVYCPYSGPRSLCVFPIYLPFINPNPSLCIIFFYLRDRCSPPGLCVVTS